MYMSLQALAVHPPVELWDIRPLPVVEVSARHCRGRKAASQKRAARKRRNVRARSSKRR